MRWIWFLICVCFVCCITSPAKAFEKKRNCPDHLKSDLQKQSDSIFFETNTMVGIVDNDGARYLLFRVVNAFTLDLVLSPPKPGRLEHSPHRHTRVDVIWHEKTQQWIPMILEGRHRAVAAAAGHLVDDNHIFGDGWLMYELGDFKEYCPEIQDLLYPIGDSIELQKPFWETQK